MSVRQELNFLVFLGFMVNYMLRANITISILDMSGTSSSTVYNKHNLSIIDRNSSEPIEDHHNGSVPLDLILDSSTTSTKWGTFHRNLILGSFYWGYICTELPGGRLAEVIGARRVWGYAILFASIFTLATPVAVSIGFIPVVILRILVGFMLGVTFPAIQPLASKWIPPMERSKFIANMMASSLGAAVTLPVCGLLISAFGWPCVFYVTGIVSLIWSIAWFMIVYDTPQDHPRITTEEREYIEKSIGAASKTRKAYIVPWGPLLSSPPVWAIVLTHGASVFSFFTIVNQMPTYMEKVFQFDIKSNGLFSSLPYLGKYLMAVSTGYIADYLRSSGKMTTTVTRKLFTTLSVGLPGFLMIIQIFKGYDATWAIILLTTALTLNGAVAAGYLGNALDIAPNFSGTIFGMANTLSSIGGFVSSGIVAVLTDGQESDYDSWRNVFIVLAVIYFLGSSIFLFCGTGELQEWNEPKLPVKLENEVELAEREQLPTENS